MFFAGYEIDRRGRNYELHSLGGEWYASRMHLFLDRRPMCRIGVEFASKLEREPYMGGRSTTKGECKLCARRALGGLPPLRVPWRVGDGAQWEKSGPTSA